MKVVPHGRVHLWTVEQIVRAPVLQIMLQELSARIAEKRVDAPVFEILETVAPVAKLLLQHEIISRGTGGPCSGATVFFFWQEDCAPPPPPLLT